MVFDCKFDGRRKGRVVAGGNHAVVVTSEEVYSGVVGSDSVLTILALAAIYPDLNVCASVVSFEFLYTTERIWNGL